MGYRSLSKVEGSVSFVMAHFRIAVRGRTLCKSLLWGQAYVFTMAGLLLLMCGSLRAQSQGSLEPNASEPAAQIEQSSPQVPGTISGTIIDQSGAAVAGAYVKLTREGQTGGQDASSDNDGRYSFTSVVPGSFTLVITSPGFAPQSVSGTLHSGESYHVSSVVLIVAAAGSEVKVSLTDSEIATAEFHDELQQRIFGFIPNIYVSYDPNAPALKPRQKFYLAWRASIDPVNFTITAAIAGVQQAGDVFSGYGQGAEGYGKRYGAAYADSVIGTLMASAVFPSAFKQDPRYFYKGTGSRRSRILYAVANAVMCKGDNGRWQANYSGLLGSLAAGGISNLYYPASDRDASTTFENALIGIGATAANNLVQEFLVRKLTKNPPKYSTGQP